MAVAALIFWLVARPRVTGRTWAEWRVVLGYGVALDHVPAWGIAFVAAAVTAAVALSYRH